ncbi:MAG: amino acid permease [Planctomycetaceae bacterium]|nr:amino acid permease [Planctomycetales bacterium]MCB9921588.1 amino acid permease [Planctomycetaceae bacterium]
MARKVAQSNMSANAPQPSAPRRQLTLFDSVCIIAGIVIGAGIYETTPAIAGNVTSLTQLMWVWVLGGLISLAGALCYVELATAAPEEGGDYVYLTRAYGRHVGFLFAWAEFWIVRPGSVGMMAFVFARFAHELLQATPLSTGHKGSDFVIYAASTIIVITIVNVLGVRTGKATQNLLTVLKVTGLALIFAVAVFTPSATVPAAETRDALHSDFRLALILALFTYGGWNDLCFVAAEVKDPERNILRSLGLGVGLIVVIYLLFNLALARATGLDGMSNSTVVSDFIGTRFGDIGRRAISLLICLSCLGAINGTLFAGSRIYYAVGTEHRFIAWLGKWNGKFDSPARALILQGATAFFWVVAFGLLAGGEEGFLRLLAFTSPVFWTFAILVSLSVFVLRYRQPDLPRPHKVVLFPITPIVFFLSCVFMLHAAFTYAQFLQSQSEGMSPEAIATGCVLIAGTAVTFLEARTSAS